MRYLCYNLVIDSEIELPEMIPVEEASGEPDIRIKLRSVPENGLPDATQIGPYLWADENRLWLNVPEVARFLSENGETIHVDPYPGIDDDSVRVFLLGSALGALLFQRGFLVLHGNAIRIGDQCLICVGPSGAGKSTLAAAFMQRGHQLLADDVVAIDEHCRAVPGFPRIKLWQDAADKMEIETRGLRRIRPDMEKFNLPIHDNFVEDAVPVRWIYILDSHHKPEFEFETYQGMQRFQPLYRNTYRVRFLESMSLRPDHLKLCGQLASRIHLTRITRPEAGFKLDELVERILEDTAERV